MYQIQHDEVRCVNMCEHICVCVFAVSFLCDILCLCDAGVRALLDVLLADEYHQQGQEHARHTHAVVLGRVREVPSVSTRLQHTSQHGF